jgi:hypothetical protein
MPLFWNFIFGNWSLPKQNIEMFTAASKSDDSFNDKSLSIDCFKFSVDQSLVAVQLHYGIVFAKGENI